MQVVRIIPVKGQKRKAEAFCPACNTLVIRDYDNAVKQRTCGCRRKELRGKDHHFYKHGGIPRELYGKWKSIHERCFNSNHKKFPRYGGRGISVCKEWDNYLPFKKWALSLNWKKGMEIDRINNNNNYSPTNCRFVTRAENCQNKSNNKLDSTKVKEIRRLLSIGKGPSEIGRMFGVSETMIRYIRKGETWKNIV